MNRILRTGLLAGALAATMVGVGYASVPLYRAFCQATGLGGTTQRTTAGEAAVAVATGKTLSIRFDANHVPALPWNFEP